jgi:hypothetical protein
VQPATSLLFLDAAPLLEKERNLRLAALLPNIVNPPRFHFSGTWATLASDNNPVDPSQINFSYVLKKRLN